MCFRIGRSRLVDCWYHITHVGKSGVRICVLYVKASQYTNALPYHTKNTYNKTTYLHCRSICC